MLILTKKQKKNAIEDHYAGIPGGEISVGRYLHKVGYTYVYVLNTWDSTTIEEYTIDDFYEDYIADNAV